MADIKINGTGYTLAESKSDGLYYQVTQKPKPDPGPVNMDTWVYGAGKGYEPSGGKYGWANGMDARIPGQIIPWPTENNATITQETVPTGSNMNMETWTGAVPDSWSKAGDLTTAKEDTEINEGTYSCQLITTTASATANYLYQSITLTSGMTNTYCLMGRRVVWRHNVDPGDNGSDIRLCLSFPGSNSEVYSEYATASGGYQELVCVAFIPPPCNTITLRIHRSLDGDTAGNDTYADDSTLTIESMSGDETAHNLFVSGDSLYHTEGRDIYKWSGTAFKDYYKIPTFRKCLGAVNSTTEEVYNTEARNRDGKVPIGTDGAPLVVYSDTKFFGLAIRFMPSYNTSTASFTDGSTTVVGSGTNWDKSMEGAWIRSYGPDPDEWYLIASVTDLTHLEITVSIGDGRSDGVKTTAADNNYNIQGYRTEASSMSITYPQTTGGTWAAMNDDVPGLSDQTVGMSGIPFMISFQKGNIDDFGYWWFLFWDVDAMTDWELTSEHNSVSRDDYPSGYAVKIDLNDIGDHSARASQIFVLEDPNTSSPVNISNLAPHDDAIAVSTDKDHPIYRMDDTNCWPYYGHQDGYGEFLTEGKGKLFTCPTDDSFSFCSDLEDKDFTIPDDVLSGQENDEITGLEFGVDRLFVGTTTGVYANILYSDGGEDWGSSYAMNKYGFYTEEIFRIPAMPSSDNFRNMKHIEGVTYLPHTKGLWALVGSSVYNLSPYLKMRAYSDFHGSVQGICQGRDWVYVVIEPDSGSKSRIMAVRYEGGDFVIHALGEVDLNDIADCTVYDDKLWILGDDGTHTEVRYFSLAGDDFPDFDANGITVYYKIDEGSWTECGGSGNGTLTSSGKVSIGASGYRIQIGICNEDDDNLTTGDPDTASCVLVTGWEDMGLPADKKVFNSVVVSGFNFATTSVSSPLTITGIKINSSADDSDNPVTVWTCPIAIGKGTPVGGESNNSPAKKQRDALHTAKNSSSITFIDVWADSHTVKVMEVEEQFANGIIIANDRRVPAVIKVVMEEIV